MTTKEQGIRMADALAMAILYALAGRMTLYRGAMKAALNPTDPRWHE